MTKTRKLLKIGKVADYLTPKEYKILCMRFGLIKGKCYTYKEIGWRYKRSSDTIAWIEKRALKKVENYMEQLRRKSDSYKLFGYETGHYNLF